MTNPTGQDVQVTFDSDEQLSTISVSISGVESATLTESSFTETDNGDGTYTYEATYSGSSEGDYTVTLDTAEDAAGNDGANSESDTVTVDTTAPSISSFSASNPSGQDVQVTFDSDEQLSTISVSISGVESATLTGSAFAETDNGNGTYTYEATYNGSSDGEYTATLDTAEDASGNDGASGQSETVVVGSSPAQFVSAYISEQTPDKIQLEFDQSLSLTDGAAGFTAAVNGDPVSITGTDNESSTPSNVTLTIGAEIAASDAVTVSYDGDSDNLVNDDGIEAEAFSVNSDDDDRFVVGIPSVTAEANADSYVVGVGTQVELRAGESVVPDGATPTFEWHVDDDFHSSNETTTVTFTDPGEHDIELTVTANGESETDTVSVIVEDSSSPTARLGTVASVPVGESITFDASNSTDNAEIVDYRWDFGDGTTVSGENLTEPTHTYDEPGYQTVEVTVVDSSGNTATTTRQVLVEGPDATLSTETLSFGEVSTTATATHVVDVTNDGTTALSVTDIALTGADAAAFEAGTGELTVRPKTISFEHVFTEPGTANVSVGLKEATSVEVFVLDVNDDGAGAQDLTGDGLRNDVDGDGAFTLEDVRLLFEHRNDTLVTQYAELFDFDGNGTGLALADIEALYEAYEQTDGNSSDVASEAEQQPAVIAQAEGSTATVYVTVSNGRDEQVTTTVPLLIDGETVTEREVTLATGETTTVRFEQSVPPSETVRVTTTDPAQSGVAAVVVGITADSA